jgi:hypothetical protein
MTEWSLVLLSIGVLLVLCCGCSTGVPVADAVQIQSQPQLPEPVVEYTDYKNLANLADVPLSLPGADFAAYAAELPDAELFASFEEGWLETSQGVAIPNATRLRFIAQVAPRIRVSTFLVAAKLPATTTEEQMADAVMLQYPTYTADLIALLGGEDKLAEDLFGELASR